MATRKTVAMIHTTAMMRISHHCMVPEEKKRRTGYHLPLFRKKENAWLIKNALLYKDGVINAASDTRLLGNINATYVLPGTKCVKTYYL